MSNQKTDLIQEQKKWYELLAQSGFEDLEYFDSKMQPKDWMKGTSKFVPINEYNSVDEPSLVYESTYEYYHQAEQSSKEIQFESEIDRQVWELHSMGISLRNIGKQLGFSHPKALRILNKYRK